jgi:hypothetical protein
MISESLEFRISQYADGTLPAAEVAALEADLAASAEARAMLAEYRALDASLKRDLPLPDIRWDRLADHLSRASRAAGASRTSRARRSIGAAGEDDRGGLHILARIGGWQRAVFAVAAMVLIVTSLALWLVRRPNAQLATTPAQVAGGGSTAPHAPDSVSPVQVAVVQVSGPAAEAATRPPEVQIAIGPDSPADNASYQVAEGIIYRAPRLAIASGIEPAQDYSSWLPY